MSFSSKLRMAGKDYDAPGYYFVTLCADERRRIFGRLVGEAIELSDVGQAAEACWRAIPEHFPDVELGAFVVMPDHVHGIVRITRWQRPKGVLAEQGDGRKKTGTRRGSLGSIVKGFKIGVTKVCRAKTFFGPMFQENYYDVICFGGVVASTFFSPGEQRLLDELLANETSRLIWILPMGMPGQVPVKWGTALLRSRALGLSAYPEDMTAATRDSCLACNE